jgi:hypothetical protein
MSFEYELRHPTGNLDPECRTILEKCVSDIGCKPAGVASSFVLEADSRSEEVTIYFEPQRLLIVVESLGMLRSPPLKSLFSVGRSLGLRLYDAGDEFPLEWGEY